jgi:uncharacterized membrane protein
MRSVRTRAQSEAADYSRPRIHVSVRMTKSFQHRNVEVISATACRAELMGVVVITLGSALACGRFAFMQKGGGQPARYQSLRQELGGAIVLGLEFLVAADIIRTVVIELSLQNVAILGLIVLIRTFLSMALQIEIDRCWPWQCRRADNADHAAPAGRRTQGTAP